MSLLEAILMGIIQGVTEFLPVSSSGHLALFKILFRIEDVGLLFDVILHLGTLIAIFAVYYKDIWKMIVAGFAIIGDACKNIGIFFKNLTHGTKGGYHHVICNGYRKFVMLVIVSTIPTGVIGVLASSLIEQAAKLLIVPGVCLILTAMLLLLADHCKGGEKMPKQVTYSNAFIIWFTSFPTTSITSKRHETSSSAFAERKYKAVSAIFRCLSAVTDSAGR